MGKPASILRSWYVQYMLTLWKKHVSRACSQVCQIILKHCQHWSTLSACQNIWWPSLAVPSDIKGSCQNKETTLCPVGQFNSFAMLTLITSALVCIPTFLMANRFQTSKDLKRSKHQKGWNESDSNTFHIQFHALCRNTLTPKCPEVWESWCSNASSQWERSNCTKFSTQKSHKEQDKLVINRIQQVCQMSKRSTNLAV